MKHSIKNLEYFISCINVQFILLNLNTYFYNINVAGQWGYVLWIKNVIIQLFTITLSSLEEVEDCSCELEVFKLTGQRPKKYLSSSCLTSSNSMECSLTCRTCPVEWYRIDTTIIKCIPSLNVYSG